MDNKKKVILVNGNGSKWYEQAIFIINKHDANIPQNIVFEAEKIINEYINKKYPSNTNIYNNSKALIYNEAKTKPKNLSKNKNKKLNNYLNLTIFCTLCIIICLAYLIFY